MYKIYIIHRGLQLPSYRTSCPNTSLLRKFISQKQTSNIDFLFLWHIYGVRTPNLIAITRQVYYYYHTKLIICGIIRRGLFCCADSCTIHRNGDFMKIYSKRFEELTTKELYEILKIRAEVFIVGQNCAYQDMDEKDKHAYHVFIVEDNRMKAYLRVLDKGISFEEVSIGRVLTTERGKGLGNEILKAGIETAKEKLGADRIKIEAQTYVRGYYEKFGFRAVSGEFLEIGIPHIEMILDL